MRGVLAWFQLAVQNNKIQLINWLNYQLFEHIYHNLQMIKIIRKIFQNIGKNYIWFESHFKRLSGAIYFLLCTAIPFNSGWWPSQACAGVVLHWEQVPMPSPGPPRVKSSMGAFSGVEHRRVSNVPFTLLPPGHHPGLRSVKSHKEGTTTNQIFTWPYRTWT